ncbi:MAG: oligosaccharide flippase family protein [Candidatus Methylomirabilales bacterium]
MDYVGRPGLLSRPSIAGSLVGVFSSQLGSVLLNFLSRVVLARLLAPADFGLFALALFVLGVAQALQDFGLSSHLVREDQRLFGNALVLKLGAAALLVSGFFLVPELFAALNPGLPALLFPLSLTLFAEAFTSIFLTVLRKRLLLHGAVLAEVGSLGLFVLASILLALDGWGVWSLVLAHVLSAYAKAVFLWFPVRWLFRPSLTVAYSWQLVRGSFYFFLIGLMSLLLLDLDKAVLGVFVPAKELGHYVMAFALIYLPCRMIENPLRRVAYPVFIQAADDRARLHESYRNFTLLSLAVELPLYLFIALNAEMVVLLLYGNQWLPIVPLVFWMSFLPLVDPFSKFGNTLLQATGKERIQYYASVPYLVFFASVGYVLTGQHGLWGMVIANYLQIGGWAITYFYLRTVGAAARLVWEVLVIYGVSCASFGVIYTLFSASRIGSLLGSAFMLIVLWVMLPLYVCPDLRQMPQRFLARLVVRSIEGR